MNFLIELYDNSLIYYPNVFFPLLFLSGILGIILMIKGTIFLNRKFTKIVKKIKIKSRRMKISTPKLTISIFYLVKFAWIFIAKVNNVLSYFELRIEKIIAKIKKEILID